MTTNEPIGVEFRQLTHRFGDVTALDNVAATIRPGTITGLVGRNGAGKTTLLSLIAGLRPVQQGTLLVDGQPVLDNAEVTTRVCLMRDKGGVWEDQKTKDTLSLQAELRPNWDSDYCMELLDRFEVRVKGRPEQLSTGKRSALGAAMALASRAPLTMIDEVYLGMDAVARRMFYNEILADYTRHPRTFVISSHLLDEVEDLMEDVIVIHRAHIIEAGDTDAIRTKYSTEALHASLTDVLLAVSGATTERA